MSLVTISVRSVFSLLLILALSILVFADTIRLKDGSILKGRIVGFSGGKFKIQIGEGARSRELTFAAVEVDSVIFDEPTQNRAVTTSELAVAKPPATEPAKQSPPRVILTSDPGLSTSNRPSSRPSNANATPIAWNVKVHADNTANGWTNSGWVVKKGQRIRISGDGKISLGRGQTTSPSGLPTLEDPRKLLKNVATGALIAVIGDDNNDFIYVGAEREFTATRDGALFLGVNEDNLNDNSGFFNVKIEIIP